MWSRDSPRWSDPAAHLPSPPEQGRQLRACSPVSFSQRPPLKAFQEPCLYSQESKKFSCQLLVPEGDNSFYIVSLCVANHVGSKTSKPQSFEGYEIRTYALQAALCTLQLFPSPLIAQGFGQGQGGAGPGVG